MILTHELVPFLAIHAARYAEEHGLDGLHPTHYDLLVKYGARMNDFKRAEIDEVSGVVGCPKP
jgi:hypothetical protein